MAQLGAQDEQNPGKASVGLPHKEEKALPRYLQDPAPYTLLREEEALTWVVDILLRSITPDWERHTVLKKYYQYGCSRVHQSNWPAGNGPGMSLITDHLTQFLHFIDKNLGPERETG